MKSRRTIALIALVVLLAVAVVMDYQYGKNNNAANSNNANKVSQMINTSNSKDKNGVTTVSSNAFADYRQERDKTRSESIANLKEIVNNSKTSQETRDKAQQEIIKLTEQTNKEMRIENLIKAKGFKDALVYIDDKTGNVLIDSDQQLTASLVAQIQDIVTRETGLSVDQIHIMKRK